MTTTPLMGLVLPVDHNSNDVWDVILDTLFGLVDGHDHTTGKGSKVPVTGLNINADLSFSPTGTPRALTDVKAVDFAAVAAASVAGLAGAFFLSDGTGGLVVNELYYRTTGGSNVRVSNGAALNVAAFAGGIGGDYAAISALLDYDDATDTYRFRQETAASVRQFAKVQFADIKLIEYDPSGDATVPTAALTIRSPDSLAGAYNLTMFTALPGSTSLVQLDSAGQFTASNTVANAVTLSGGIAGTPNFTGAVTMASTLAVTSTVATSGSNLTSGANRVQLKAPGGLAANYDVTWPAAVPAATQVMRMSSSGVITTAAGTETRQCDAAQITISANAVTNGVTRASGAAVGGGFVNLGTSTDVIWMPLQVSLGEVITAWNCRVFKSSATGTISAQLFTWDGTTQSAIGAASTNGAASPGAIFLQLSGLSTTVVSNQSYYIRLNGGGTTGDSVSMYGYSVTVSP